MEGVRGHLCEDTEQGQLGRQCRKLALELFRQELAGRPSVSSTEKNQSPRVALEVNNPTVLCFVCWLYTVFLLAWGCVSAQGAPAGGGRADSRLAACLREASMGSSIPSDAPWCGRPEVSHGVPEAPPRPTFLLPTGFHQLLAPTCPQGPGNHSHILCSSPSSELQIRLSPYVLVTTAPVIVPQIELLECSFLPVLFLNS